MDRTAGAMFRSIVVGTDGSPTAGTAVDHAVALAHRGRARLHIVSVYEPPAERLATEPTQVPDDVHWSMGPRAEVLDLLAAAEAAARGAGLGDVETFARQGDAAEAILDVAEELGADLIVVGHKGMKGAERFLLGSVPHRVSHHAPCSVLIVRTG